MRSMLAFLLSIATIGSFVFGQNDNKGYDLKIQSNIVLVPTRVETKDGETIYGLNAKQFVIEDNGIGQAVHLDEDTDGAGVSLVVAVQCSRSAGLEFAKLSGLGTMIESIVGDAPHEVAVVVYGAGPTLLGGFSSNSDDLNRALSKVKPCHDYGAVMLDTVYYATRLLDARHNHYRHAILLIGETRDHGSHSNPQEVISALGVTNTLVDSVAFSPGRDEFVSALRYGPGGPPDAPSASLTRTHPPPVETGSSSSEPNAAAMVAPEHPPLVVLPPLVLLAVNALRSNAASQLAALSGGQYTNFATQKGFDESLQSISNTIHNYYSLSFRPTNAAVGFHSLKVRVPDYPDALVRTRESYWSGNVRPASGDAK
jgi:VWFA-related protein